MPRKWGKVDYSTLLKLRDDLEKFQQIDSNAFCSKMAKEIAARLLRRVKQKTPVGTVPQYASQKAKDTFWVGYKGGELRDKWKVQADVTKKGNEYEIEVYNPLEYASYVEYGHRQQVGRYVPQLGLKLKSAWVDGKFMLKISEEEIQSIAPKLLQKRLEEELRKLFNA